MAEKVFDGEIQIKNKVDKNPILDMYKRMMDYNKGMERSLSNQVMYSKMLRNNLKGLGNIKLPKSPTNLPSTSQQPTAPTKDKPMVPEYVGEMGPQLPKSIAKERRKEEREITKENQRQLALEEEKTKVLKRNRLFLQKELTTEEQITKEAIAQQIADAKSKKQVKDIVSDEMARLNAKKRQTTQLKKQSFLMQRMQASSQQFAGNMVSAFAVAAGVTGVVRIGQDFEAVNNTMLAVSENSEVAGENFQFVRDEAFRLGLGLKESAKGFAKMVAARGDMTLEDTKAAFTGISEMGTLLGLSAEEGGRAINALQQMMSKGVVSAEELKLQMGEVLPNAIPLMAKAAQDAGISISGSVKEMMDLQQNGELISSKVLPHFARRMSEAAQANGGLEKAMDSNRVAMNRMMMSMQEASDSFFKSGFSEGLTDFFNETATLLRENQALWKSLGKIIGGILKGLSKLIKIVTPLISALGSVMHSVTNTFGDFSALVVPAFTALAFTVLPKSVKEMTLLGRAIGVVAKAFKKAFLSKAIFELGLKGLVTIGAIAAGEEIAEYWSPTGKETVLPSRKEFAASEQRRNLLQQKAIDMGVSPYIAGGFSSQMGAGLPYRTQPPININNTTVVEIDGEKVVESVTSKSSFDEAVNRSVGAGYIISR